MAISRELFLSILSLDSYNRGYNAGISGLSDAIGTQIGNATILSKEGDETAQAAGFYAIAYDVSGVAAFQAGPSAETTVIAYRGTDVIPCMMDLLAAAGDERIARASCPRAGPLKDKDVKVLVRGAGGDAGGAGGGGGERRG